MIGQTIESRPSPPLDVVVWLLLGITLDVLALVYSNPHLAIASLLPWSTVVLLVRARSTRFVARFTDSALEVEEPTATIFYSDLQGLVAPARPANPFKSGRRSYAIQVIHRDGILEIPARLNVPSDEVFSFCFGRFSPCGSREVPARLKEYLNRSERIHGPERVWTYCARSHLGRGPQPRRLQRFFWAAMITGIAWFCWGLLREEPGWMGPGAVGFVFGVLFSYLIWLTGRRPYQAAGRRWRQSGLVIAPNGLALVQNDLIGELRWEELKDAQLRKGNQWRSDQRISDMASTVANILLKVEGAVIVIADVYDRPIALIYQNLCFYWRGGIRDEKPRSESSGIRKEIQP